MMATSKPVPIQNESAAMDNNDYQRRRQQQEYDDHQQEQSGADDSFLSKSLSHVTGIPVMNMHRARSETSDIKYSGYLLKRSNQPFSRVAGQQQQHYHIPIDPINNSDGIAVGNGIAQKPQQQPLQPRISPPPEPPLSSSFSKGTVEIKLDDNGTPVQPVDNDRIGGGYFQDGGTKYWPQHFVHNMNNHGGNITNRPNSRSAMQANTDYVTNENNNYDSENKYSSISNRNINKSSNNNRYADENNSNFEDSPLVPVVNQSSPIEHSLNMISSFFGVEMNNHDYNDNRNRSPFSQHHVDGKKLNKLNSPPIAASAVPIVTAAATQAKSAPIAMKRDITPQSSTASDSSSIDVAKLHRRDSAPVTMAQTPPADFIDPDDGHIWRSKYCVLEDGVLYFYRNAEDGESLEAQTEREQKTPALHDDDDDDNAGLTYGGRVEDYLAKSPMVRPKVLQLEQIGGRYDVSLDDSNTNVIWEKRVALDCVGAVRSAELEYGECAIELLAVSSDGDQPKQDSDEEANTLILRARNTEEMNEWMFQFHRSLATVMKQIVETIGSPMTQYHHAATNFKSKLGSYCDINHQYHMLEPRSTRTAPYSPAGRYRELKQPSSAMISLSHGHGRSALHRKRPTGPRQPGNNRASPPMLIYPSEESFVQPNTVHSSSLLPPKSSLQIKRQDRRNDSDIISKEVSPPKETSSTAKLELPVKTSGKYIPPHLRNRSQNGAAGNSGRYVPPHLRQNQSTNKPFVGSSMETNTNDIQFSSSREGPVLVPMIQKKNLLPPSDTEFTDKEKPDVTSKYSIGSEGRLGDNIGESIEVDQTPVKLGGCADPKVAVGSIVDPMYKERKSSRVGKVHTDSFGCFGGGPVLDQCQEEDTSDSNYLRPLQWEVGVVSECGIRDSNEDSYVIATDLMKAFKASHSFHKFKDKLNHQNLWIETASHQPGLFAIFDGHCENQTARYAAEKLISFVLDETIEFESSSDAASGAENIEQVLLRAISNLDDAFCRLCTSDGREWESGATALIAALANDGDLVIANLGDCRGVMCCSVVSSLDDDIVEDCVSPNTLRKEAWTELEVDDGEGDSSKWVRATGDGMFGSDIKCFWKEVTDTHSPSRSDERKRIEEANGWITTEKEIPIGQLQRMDFCDEDVIEILKRCFSDRYHSSEQLSSSKRCSAAPQRILQISRVCGELAVSRALGDRDFKAAFNTASSSSTEKGLDNVHWDSPLFLPYPDNHTRRFKGDLILPIPEVQALKVGQEGVVDEFLLLACDGLWDVMDSDDAVRVARGLLYEKKWSARKVAERLAEIAIHLGSSDNITVIVIRFFKGF